MDTATALLIAVVILIVAYMVFGQPSAPASNAAPAPTVVAVTDDYDDDPYYSDWPYWYGGASYGPTIIGPRIGRHIGRATHLGGGSHGGGHFGGGGHGGGGHGGGGHGGGGGHH